MRLLHALLFTTVFVTTGCCWLCLDEEQILKDSHEAFAEQAYHSEPYEKAGTIQHFANFLLLNADTLISYNRHDDYCNYQSQDGQQISILKKGNCFKFITTSSEFITEYAPSHLRDSLIWYIEQLNPMFIPQFTLCNKRGGNSINTDHGSVVFNFGYKHDPADNPNYSLYHLAYKNQKERNYHRIESTVDILQKDTTLVGDIKYAIRVLPYNGW